MQHRDKEQRAGTQRRERRRQSRANTEKNNKERQKKHKSMLFYTATAIFAKYIHMKEKEVAKQHKKVHAFNNSFCLFFLSSMPTDRVLLLMYIYIYMHFRLL